MSKNKQTQEILSSYVNEYVERHRKVLQEDYITWLTEFVKRIKSFDDEPNRVHYCGEYTPEEQEKIYLISTLFSEISDYYEKNNIEFDVMKADFFNQAVTVNLEDEVSIEMRLWVGQGSETDVSLIKAGTGKVNIWDVVKSNGIKCASPEQQVSRNTDNHESFLTTEYTNWLERFINEHKQFCDEYNSKEFESYSEEDKENIRKLPLYIMLVNGYYATHGIRYCHEDEDAFTIKFTLNLSEQTAIKVDCYITQNPVTHISLIDSGTGETNIVDVMTIYKK